MLANNTTPNPFDSVVEEIISGHPLGARVGTENLEEEEFRVVELTLGRYFREEFRQRDLESEFLKYLGISH